MTVEDDKANGAFSQEDHKVYFAPQLNLYQYCRCTYTLANFLILPFQVAYIFHPEDSAAPARPTKRRRVSKKGTKAQESNEGSSISALGALLFVPLLNGAESGACVRQRYQLYEESWAMVHNRIQVCFFTLTTEITTRVHSSKIH